MYARVARWEATDAEAMRQTAERIKERAQGGPPEGVPASGFRLLIDPENGRALAIGFFETEDDLRQGDAALKDMTPPDEGLGQIASVEFYEVAVEAGTV